MEKKFHHYNIEGLEFDVPLKKREGEYGYIENYDDLIDNLKYTPSGKPVILTCREPCEMFAKALSDCAECVFFKKADSEHFTLIGICTYGARKNKF